MAANAESESKSMKQQNNSGALCSAFLASMGQSSNLRSFTFSDLKNATRNFRSDSLLGEGGFGYVFKGWIDEQTFAPCKPGTGLVVAVKKLKAESVQGHREWLVCALNFQILLLFIQPCTNRSNKTTMLCVFFADRSELFGAAAP